MNILETEGLTKVYPGVTALDNFSFSVKEGEVHGLVGENGAGKSTLVKILAGAIHATSGTMKLNGKTVRFRTPHDARDKIGVVHQERELIGHFDGSANIFLGREKAFGPFIDRAGMRAQAAKLASESGINVPLDCPVEDLGNGQQEMIMILRVLQSSPHLIVLDEPTASLSAGECEVLYELIGKLKKTRAVLYISHNLAEVIRLCDRITVMRNGRKVSTVEKGVKESDLIRLMVDHDIKDQYPKVKTKIGDVVFEAKDFSCQELGIKDADFHIRHGETVGFAGLVGAGRSELAQSVFCGLKHTGKLTMREQEFRSTSPASSIKSGMVMVPEDRRGEGIVTGLSVARNIQLPGFKGPLCHFGFINFPLAKDAANKAVTRYGIKIADLRQPIDTLSGGNQQKASVGKWSGFSADLWIFDEPTQGIDVEAKREIYNIMGNIAQSGAGIWFISSELRELTALSDRIYVMNGGKIIAEFLPPFNREKILTAMTLKENRN